MGWHKPITGTYWSACPTHRTVFQGGTCPHDPCVNQQRPSIDNCPVASDRDLWDTREKAERWLLRDEVRGILADADRQLEKGYSK